MQESMYKAEKLKKHWCGTREKSEFICSRLEIHVQFSACVHAPDSVYCIYQIYICTHKSNTLNTQYSS